MPSAANFDGGADWPERAAGACRGFLAEHTHDEVRFFHDGGWVGDFTGDPIAERIPDFDTIVAGRPRG